MVLKWRNWGCEEEGGLMPHHPVAEEKKKGSRFTLKKKKVGYKNQFEKKRGK
jgi:hypothetical protein